MSRKRKTRKEKIIAQLRKQQGRINSEAQSTPQQNTYNIVTAPHLKAEDKPVIKNEQTYPVLKRHPRDYTYISGEIKKTITVTLAILLVNLSLYFLLTRNLINLKFLGI